MSGRIRLGGKQQRYLSSTIEEAFWDSKSDQSITSILYRLGRYFYHFTDKHLMLRLISFLERSGQASLIIDINLSISILHRRYVPLRAQGKVAVFAIIRDRIIINPMKSDSTKRVNEALYSLLKAKREVEG